MPIIGQFTGHCALSWVTATLPHFTAARQRRTTCIFQFHFVSVSVSFFLAKYWQGLERISMFVLAVSCHCFPSFSLLFSLLCFLSLSICLLVMSASGWAYKPMLMTCKLCLNCGFAATKWHFDCPPKFISTHSAFIIFVDSFSRSFVIHSLVSEWV